MRPRLLIRLPGLALTLAVVSALHCMAPLPVAGTSAILSAEEAELYRTAFGLIEKGEELRGLELARQGSQPLANKVSQWIDLTRRDTQRRFSEIDQFRRTNPHWPRQYQLLRNAELTLPNVWSAEQVLAWFGNRPPITGAGALSYCLALLELGKEEDLTKAAPLYWTSMDFGTEEEREFLDRFGDYLTVEDEHRRMSRLLWDRRTSAARRQLNRVQPGQAALARARMALYRNRPGVDAAIRKVPDSLRNDEGLSYERAVWRKRRNRFDGVVAVLNDSPAQSDHMASWWSLKKWAVWRALDREDWDLALELSQRHGLREGLGFAEGEWLAGWIALVFLKNPETAAVHFATLFAGVSTPISKARGAFWAGEAQSALGNAAEARGWYARAAAFPATFYGQLATQRAGRSPAVALARLPTLPMDAESAYLAKEIAQAARLMGEVGQAKLQRTFILHLRKGAKTQTDYRILAEFAASMNRQDLAIRVAKAARRRGLEIGDLMYPKPLLPSRSGVEPALVLAVIRQESEFYPKARSSAGALGLMQLMPATARHTARGTGLPYDRKRLTDDPTYNLRLGQAYLEKLLAEFDGSYILALAAYNAGPARAKQWIRKYGDPRTPSVDPVQWTERIPFSETRNYIQRIIESLLVYRGMAPPQTPVWNLRLGPLGS